MLFFTYLGMLVAALGTIVGAFSLFMVFMHFGTPEISDMHFRMGVPVFLGSILIGILAEISMSLRKKTDG